jgi:hypothetical protein
MVVNLRRFNRDSIRPTAVQQDDNEREKNFSFTGEVVRSIGTGAHDFIESFANLPSILPGIDYNVEIDDWVDEPETTAGRFAAVGVQFAVPLLGWSKLLTVGARLAGLECQMLL